MNIRHVGTELFHADG